MDFVFCSCEMDSFKLGIFLMLIVGGTALGSGNEASKVRLERLVSLTGSLSC